MNIERELIVRDAIKYCIENFDSQTSTNRIVEFWKDELKLQEQKCNIPIVSQQLGSNCAFQYYNGSKVVCDEFEITLEEAKVLWNKYYDDMVEKTTEDLEIEVAIWINMKNSTDYRETLIHLSSPEVRNGKLYEPKYYDKF